MSVADAASCSVVVRVLWPGRPTYMFAHVALDVDARQLAIGELMLAGSPEYHGLAAQYAPVAADYCICRDSRCSYRTTTELSVVTIERF